MAHEPLAGAVAVQGGGARSRPIDPPLVALLVADLLLFAGGALAHSGVAIPLVFGTWIEPVVLPARIIEGVGATVLAAALVGRASRLAWADHLTRWALWYCFVGVLWGMLRRATGSGSTESNDLLHIAMTLVTTVALVRLAGRRR